MVCSQTIITKFNLYDYSLIAAITLCCYAYMVRHCNLVLIGRLICFMVNCKSSYAISTMLVCVACAKVITPYSNNFLSFALSPKYLCIDICMKVIRILCCYVYFMVIVQCYVVDICMSVCLFGVVAYILWLCRKCYCG